MLPSFGASLKLLTESETIQRALELAANPEEFIRFLARDARRFPLTSFSLKLKTKDLAEAESIAHAASEKLVTRQRRISDCFADTLLIHVVAAQVADGKMSAALRICAGMTRSSDRALAYRVLAEWCLKRGDIAGAQTACRLVDEEFERLPEADKTMIDAGSYERLSDGAPSVVVQQGITRRLLMTGLAARGRNHEAIAIGNIHDAGQRVAAGCALLKGFMIGGDPFADEFLSTLLRNLKRAGRLYYQVNVFEAQAEALLQMKNWSAAIEALERGMKVTDDPDFGLPDELRLSFKSTLLLKKAQAYRQSGNEEAAIASIAEMLRAAETALAYRESIKALKFAPTQTKDSIRRIREILISRVAANSDGIDKLLSLALVQRRGNDAVGAQETVKVAAALHSKSKNSDLEAVFLGEEQAQVGDFAGAKHTLVMLKRAEDRERLLRTLAIEQAKRGKLKEALDTMQGSSLTDERLDEIGAALIGVIETIELFPYLKSD